MRWGLQNDDFGLRALFLVADADTDADADVDGEVEIEFELELELGGFWIFFRHRFPVSFSHDQREITQPTCCETRLGYLPWIAEDENMTSCKNEAHDPEGSNLGQEIRVIIR